MNINQRIRSLRALERRTRDAEKWSAGEVNGFEQKTIKRKLALALAEVATLRRKLRLSD